MKKNIGETDSLVRLFSGLALVVLVVLLYKVLPVGLIIAAYGLALVLAVTGAFGYCPLYTLFGINKKGKTTV